MRLILTALTAVLLGVAAPGQPAPQPPATLPTPASNVPGGKVVLVPRSQLRAGPNVKTARLPHPVRAAAEKKEIPIPAEWDWTKGDTTKLPILGNDRYGDCYYVAPAHVFQLYGGLAGSPVTFDVNALVRRYQQLSGGDNGLSDEDVFPEVKRGIVGPDGPHKILDVLVVPATDKTAVDLTGWAFGPQMFTFTVYSNFMNVGPGTVLDGNSGGVQGGHAVVISGKKADGKRKLETWGIQPSVLVTDKWVHGVDPEYVACFSMEWFNKDGWAPNGLHYTTLAPLWNSMGGSVPVPGPFPPPLPPQPPVPPVPPVPPTPPQPPTPPASGFTGTLTYVNGVLVSVGPVKPTPAPPALDAFLADAFSAGKAPPAVILADLIALYAAYQTKNPVAIAAAVAQLLADLQAKAPPMSAAPAMPSSVPGATLYGCYVDPVSGQTVCPQQPAPQYRFAPFGGRFRP